MSECIERQIFDARVSFETWASIPFTIMYGLFFSILQLSLSFLNKEGVISEIWFYIIIIAVGGMYFGAALYIKSNIVKSIFPLLQIRKKLFSAIDLNNEQSDDNIREDKNSLKIWNDVIKLSYDIVVEKIIEEERLIVAEGAPFNIFYSLLLLLAVAFVSSPLENDKVPLFIIPYKSLLEYIRYYYIYILVSFGGWVVTYLVRKHFRDKLVSLLQEERHKSLTDDFEK